MERLDEWTDGWMDGGKRERGNEEPVYICRAREGVHSKLQNISFIELSCQP